MDGARCIISKTIILPSSLNLSISSVPKRFQVELDYHSIYQYFQNTLHQ